MRPSFARIKDRLAPLSRRALRARRKRWSSERRFHLQLRQLTHAELERAAPRIEQRLEEEPAVRWARVNGYLRRVVIELEDGVEDPHETLEAGLAAVEEELGIADHKLPLDDVAPGDRLPLRRIAVEIGADALGFAVNTVARTNGKRRSPWGIDLAALPALIEGIPDVRDAISRRLSSEMTDLLLEGTKAAASIALGSETGPLTSFARHWLRFRDARARAQVWAEREPELCGERDLHVAVEVPLPPRPAPLRPGPIERYEDEAVPIVLSLFGAGALVSHTLEKGALAVFGGFPGAAHRARNSFAHHLSWLLAQRGVLVLDTVTLRVLDRLDVCLLHESALRDRPGVERKLESAARAAGMRLILVDGRGMLENGEREVRDVAELIRAHQGEGEGVLFVAGGFHPAYRAADLSAGLVEGETPWGAAVLCRHGLDDVTLLFDAVCAAKQVAEQGVALAAVEALVSSTFAFQSLGRRTTRRVMLAGNAASFLSMLNGVRHAEHLKRPTPPTARVERHTEPWHELEPDEVLRRVRSAREGLSAEEARQRHKPPATAPSPRRHFVRMVKAELDNPMTPVLGAGVALSAVTGSLVDAGLLAAVVGLNGVVGGTQRARTERAMSELEERERQPVRVRRDGQLLELPQDEVVVGDVVELHAGDSVYGDCRLLAAENLEVEESSLTGESLPVSKCPAPTPGAAVPDRHSMLFAGTSIAAGSAVAVVVALEDDTEAGRAAAFGSVHGERRGGVEERLERLGSLVAPIAGISIAAMTGSGLLRRRPPSELIASAVSLGVASVPEGLPILATMAQLAAARRLSAHGALVRNPRAIEPLGRVDVLCADKTGTLTEGHIRLALVSDGEREEPVERASDELREVLAVALRASPAAGAKVVPHATDRALIEGSAAVGVAADLGREPGAWRRVAELPFEPARGFHATVDRGEREGARCVLSVKGAPEVVLPRCRAQEGRGPLDDDGRERLEKRASALARKGFRVLAVAERSLDGAPEEMDEGDVDGLAFRGFVAYRDPVRESARQAIADLKSAGVDVIMLTGDHPSTAEAIGAELGLINGHTLMTGAALDELSDEELDARVEQIAVFARVTPLQKVRLLKALKRRGRTVAMTGDGANDAPAIRLADVGIALGEGATAAARHAADIVITDGRIETIVHAVLEGRALWRSVRDAVAVLVGGNVGEVGFMVLGGLATGSAPLNARQLLLVNLVTDSFPALTIAVRPPRHVNPKELLDEGPEASLGRTLERDILWRGGITAAAGAAAWGMARVTGGKKRASTVALLGICGAELGQTLAAGGLNRPVLLASLGSLAVVAGAVQLPVVSHFFGCRPLGPLGLAQAAAVSGAATGVAWLAPKLTRRLRARRSSARGANGSRGSAA